MPGVPTPIEGVLLDIDGARCGTVWSAQGGDGIAPVVQERSSDQSKKHIQPPEWQDFELQFSLPLHRTVYDWITAWWRREAKPRTVGLTAYDPALRVIRRREFQRALITETTVSALNALSSEPVMLKLKLTPEFVQTIPPSGTVPAPSLPQPWLARNFRLDLPGLDGTKIIQIDSFTVKQPPVEASPYGGELAVPGPLSFPNLTVTLPELSAATWQAWFDDFVVKGNTDTQEKTGRLALLDGTLRERVRIDLSNVGIFRFTSSAWTRQDTPEVVAGLYCERMDFAVLL
jgi:hypothetical protein